MTQAAQMAVNIPRLLGLPRGKLIMQGANDKAALA
jgi:hypothetical protein